MAPKRLPPGFCTSLGLPQVIVATRKVVVIGHIGDSRRWVSPTRLIEVFVKLRVETPALKPEDEVV